MLARQTAAAALAADTRSRAALYRALGRAHDFALAVADDTDGYAALLAEAGLAVQARAPMTPIVKLVFGMGYDKTRLTEFAAVLSFANRQGIGPGALSTFLEHAEGGIKGVVKAERAERRPAKQASRTAEWRAALDRRPAIASVALDTHSAVGDYILLLARAAAGGTLDIVARMDDDAALTERAIRAASN
jgi:GNAT superfamily N-acetyltransferase